MECRKFDINLISATGLENVRRFHRMGVYARVSIGRDGPEERTETDQHGEANPVWDFETRFMVSESVVKSNTTKLVVKLFCTRMMGDRYIGEVRAPMKELFDASGGGAEMSLPVQRGCKNSQGVVRFSYRFGEKVTAEPSEKGPGIKRFPWEKVVEVLIEGVKFLLVHMDEIYGPSGSDYNDGYDSCDYDEDEEEE